jgi:hypothetical protein
MKRTLIALALALFALHAPAQRPLDVRAFGAKCDGKTNDAAAIQKALNAAATVRGVARVPNGKTCAYGATITVQGATLAGFGDSSILYALDVANEAVFLKGTGSQIRSLRLSGVTPTERQAPWQYSRVVMLGARGFVVDGVTIDASAGAGIMVDQGSRGGVITNNRIRNTLADSIHMTGASSFLRVENNFVENSGDDGVAVVSYQSSGMVRNVVARGNTIRNNNHGRLMSVVGGTNVLYEYNTLDTNTGAAACLYLAQENSYHTFGAHNVIVRANTLRNCPVDDSKQHGALMLFSDGAEPNTGIVIARNIIVQEGAQAAMPGLRVFGDNTDVQIVGNLISTQGKALDVSTPNVVVAPYMTLLPVGDPGGRQ